MKLLKTDDFRPLQLLVYMKLASVIDIKLVCMP